MEASTTPAANLAVARDLYACFLEGDTDAIRSRLDPDVRALPSLDGGPRLRGADAVLGWWRSVQRAGSNVEARPLGYEIHGDCVIVRGYLRHQEGRMLTERTTYWLHEIANGRVVRMESHPTREAALSSV